MSWFEINSYLVINYSGINPIIFKRNVIHLSCSCNVKLYLATWSFHWVRGVKQNSTFWCSWPYNRGRDSTILWEAVWFVKVKQDFWTNQEVSFFLYNKTLNYFIHHMYFNIRLYHFTVFSCQKIRIQDTFNFGCKYKVTRLFLDDEWGKDFVLYVGKCSTLCTKIWLSSAHSLTRVAGGNGYRCNF